MTSHRYTKPFREYFASHGIDEEIAGHLGIHGVGKKLSFPYRGAGDDEYLERTKNVSNGEVRQPARKPVVPWTPVGTGGDLLVCEGEPDCLAAISALYEIVEVPDERDGYDRPKRALQRGRDLPPPIATVTPIAIPGVNTCHEKVAKLAERKRAAGEEFAVWIALDGDEVGRTNALKLAKKIGKISGIKVGVLPVPDQMDLSDVSVAAENSVEAIANLVAEAEAAAEDIPVDAEPADGDKDAVKPLFPEAIGGLLDQVLGFMDRYVVLPGNHERSAVALWVAHTYAIDAAHATAYLLIVSPEKRSGKTRAMETLELLVDHPWRVTGASEAAMFRKISKDKPSLLLDEIDAIFGSNAERTEPLRAILNSGNRPGATVARCVGEGKDVEDFSVFCAKALAGIDNDRRIPDTIRDRSVAIRMHRKTGAEPVERLRFRVADAEAEGLREELRGWAAGTAVDLLRAADPDLPVELDDRAAEAWEALLAIADLAGGEWPERARTAAIALSGEEDRDEVTTGTLLLSAIRKAFGDRDRVTTTDLLRTINGDEELPFGGWSDGKGLDGRRLAKLLKPYRVKPKTIRLEDGSTAKGYLRDSLGEVWERWLAPHPEKGVTSVTAVTGDETVTDKGLARADVTPVTHVTLRDDGVTESADGDVDADLRAEAERLEARFGAAA